MSNRSLRAGWPAALQREFAAGKHNGCVGSILVSETDRVRVWHLHISAGTRCGFHRHVLDYFWTALSDGRARTYHEDGRIVEGEVRARETRHFGFAAGEHMVHSIENIGDTDLAFTTVEFLGGANSPLPVPDGVRLGAT